MYPTRDRTGEKVNHLTFIRCLGGQKQGQGARWLVRCDCGTEKEVTGKDVSRGKIKTCGIKCPHYIENQETYKYNDHLSKWPREERFHRHIYKEYFDAALLKGREWELTFERFRELVTGDCHYCSAPPRPRGIAKTRGTTNGIDRVNNKLGYIPSNCVSCCTACNIMKRATHKDVFIEHCLRIAATHLQTIRYVNDSELHTE